MTVPRSSSATREPVFYALSLALGLALVTGVPSHERHVRAETRPGYGGTVKAGLLGAPATVDPVRARTHADTSLVALLFDTLYRVDGKQPDGSLRVVPHLASALPEVDASGLSARVPVRTDVRFHDGTALRSTDVTRSLARLRTSAASGYLLAPVKNIVRRGDAVVFTLHRKTPELAALLSAPAAAITPAGKPPTWRRAMGSGPYRLARLDGAKKSLHLFAHERHFAGRPYLDKLLLSWYERPYDEATAYESGTTHLSLRGAVAYDGHIPKYRTREATGPATILAYVGFGRTRAHARITGDIDFRRALSLAVERDAFRSVGTGEQIAPSVHPVATAIGGPPTAAKERRARLSQARAALGAAARRVEELSARADRDRDGVRDFELELIVDRTRPDDRAIAGKVVLSLYRLGIKARIVELDTATFAERVRTDACDLYIGQLAMPLAIPEVALVSAFVAGGDDWATGVFKRAGIGDPRGFDRARGLRQFAARLPIVPLFHRALRVHHRDDVRGIHFDDSSRLQLTDLFFFGRPRRSK